MIEPKIHKLRWFCLNLPKDEKQLDISWGSPEGGLSLFPTRQICSREATFSIASIAFVDVINDDDKRPVYTGDFCCDFRQAIFAFWRM